MIKPIYTDNILNSPCKTINEVCLLSVIENCRRIVFPVRDCVGVLINDRALRSHITAAGLV